MPDDDETVTSKPFQSTDQQISHLKFDDETDRIAKYRLDRLKSDQDGYLKIYNRRDQYRYPIDSNHETNAIQLKRSYPKNYQQYRLLRSRLPRDRPSIRTKKENGLKLKELESSSTKNEKKSTTSKLINDTNHQSTKEQQQQSLNRMSRILSSKIISLKDNEKTDLNHLNTKASSTSLSTTTDQRINFRNELLPKINIAYHNLIKRTGQLNTEQANSNQQSQSNELIGQSKTSFNNQLIKINSTSNLSNKPSNDASLLTNVSSENRNLLDRILISSKNHKNNTHYNDDIINLTSSLLSSDASSLQETTHSIDHPINSTNILNLIKNLTSNGTSSSFDLISDNSTDLSSNNESLNDDELSHTSFYNDDSFNDLKDLKVLENSSAVEFDKKKSTDSISNSDRIYRPETNDSPKNFYKSNSMISPLELHLIKLSPTKLIISNRD